MRWAMPGEHAARLLQGWPLEVRPGIPFLDGSAGKQPVEIEFGDPMKRVKKVALDFWVGAPGKPRQPTEQAPKAVDGDHDNLKQPYGGLWIGSYSQLAKLYGITVVGVSNVGWLRGGPWEGRKCIGCSLAVGPGGEILAQGPYGEAAEDLIMVDVEPRRPLARGTEIAAALAAKGYDGP